MKGRACMIHVGDRFTWHVDDPCGKPSVAISGAWLYDLFAQIPLCEEHYRVLRPKAEPKETE